MNARPPLQFAKFLGVGVANTLVALVAYGMNLLTVMAAIHYAGLNGYLAQALGIPPYTLTSFLASKYLVFRAGPAPADEPNHGQH